MHGIELGAEDVRKLADRHTGIGCDQLIVLEPPCHPRAQLLMQIRNPDGSTAEACGNATRCVALLLHRETGDRSVRIETAAGLLEAVILPDQQVAVDMGVPRTGWREIPLARAEDTVRVDIAARTAGRAGLHQYRQPARDVFCRRRRGDRSRQIWSGARASSIVSASAPISGWRPFATRSSQAAGVGTRRRDDPRLWQCGLRGTCRRSPQRARRAPGGGRTRWRHARHSLARRWSCDHDRAGDA